MGSGSAIVHPRFRPIKENSAANSDVKHNIDTKPD
jgi:hypothetical protein